MPSDTPIRIAIADDHPIFRLGVRSLLATEPGVELVGEARDGVEALEMVQQCRPDILLLDLAMPRMGGLDALPRLASTNPEMRIVVLTASLEPSETSAALLHGARGVLLKHTASELLGQCVRQVMEGEYFVRRQSVAKLADALPARVDTSGALTTRELEIVAGVVHAESNKQIAARLNIGEQTVKNHLRNIFEKLGVTNRVELALTAVEKQLVSSD